MPVEPPLPAPVVVGLVLRRDRVGAARSACAPPASCARCSAGSGRTGCCRTWCSVTARTTSGAGGSGSRGAIPSRPAISTRRASRSHRLRRSPLAGRASAARCRAAIVPRRAVAEARRVPLVALRGARFERVGPRHADPSLGVRARHTPPWMRQLARMPLPWWQRIAERIDAGAVRAPPAQRHAVHPGGGARVRRRGSADVGARGHAKAHDFELRRMPATGSVLIEDLAFNAILVVANRALESIADALSQRLPAALVDHMARTPVALETLWDEDAGQYFSRDSVGGALIPLRRSRRSFRSGRALRRPRAAERLVAALQTPAFRPRFPVPSVPVDAPSSARRGTGRARRGSTRTG